jgi:hypothetical protein
MTIRGLAAALATWAALVAILLCLTGCMSFEFTTSQGGSGKYITVWREPAVPFLIITKGPGKHDSSFQLKDYTVQESFSSSLKMLLDFLDSKGLIVTPTP